MIKWPGSLVKEVASRRAIFFIGSGLSAGSHSERDQTKRPPDWRGLLIEAAAQFVASETIDYINELIASGKLLDAAEVIFHGVSSPEKKEFFTEKFSVPAFLPNACHEAIQKIDPKIVITTNYDQIYEIQCSALVAGRGYVVKKFYDKDLLDCVRSRDNIIIKAHGCISQPNDLVITRSDYYRIKKEHAQFYNVLDSLITVSTVIFIGCSMTDPDVQLVLENTNIAVPSSHTHYAVMPAGLHPALRSAMESSYNIKILEYIHDGDHAPLFLGLNELMERVSQERISI